MLFFGQPDYRNPQSQQASLGVERQIGESVSVSANYIYVHTTHLPWAVDKNLLAGSAVRNQSVWIFLSELGRPVVLDESAMLCRSDTHDLAEQ